MNRVSGVSVVMATLNGARHVREQLDSIAQQTVKPLEILIGDDGSTDLTLDILREFRAATDIPVEVTVNEHRLGYAENFLQTATRASGEFIAFADQDDVWLPGKLAAATRALASSDVTMWICGWRIVDEDLTPVPDRWLHTGFAQSSALAYPMHVPHGARAVFRRELLDYMPPAGRSRSVYGQRPAHHDEWVMFAAHVFGQVASESTPTMLYRRHASAVSADCPPMPSRRHLLNKDGEAADDDVVAAATDRARYLLERAEAPECEPVRARMLEAAGYYDQLIPRLVRRATTQTAPARTERASSLVISAASGDYRSLSKGGLGFWVFLQDSFALTR